MLDLLPADPRFWWLVVGGSAVSMAAYLVFALPFVWLAWRDPPWARRFRIQQRPFPVRRFTGPGFGRWLVNNAAMLAVAALAWPLLRHSGLHTGALPSAGVWAGQLVLFVLLDDAAYYVMHRAMHRGWLWQHVHKVHHRVVTPFAATAHYMHPLEYVATGTLMLAGPLLLGVHVAVLYSWIVLRQWEAVEGHCGYSFAASPTRWLPVFDGPDHHDFHHSRFHGNYAGYLPHLDRWLGTLSRGFEDHVATRDGGPPPAT